MLASGRATILIVVKAKAVPSVNPVAIARRNDTVGDMKPARIPSLVTLVLLAGCNASARRATENVAIEKQAAQEVRRICALPPAQRDAELARIEKESGIVVRCGRE
jgi:hypothetical protein